MKRRQSVPTGLSLSRSLSPTSKGISLDHMTAGQIGAWIEQKREALTRKMQRERAYLDRRAARGTHTPTDDAYEQDQLLEADLLALLDFVKKSFT